MPTRASRLGPRGQTDMLNLFFTSSMLSTSVRRYSKIFVRSLFRTVVRLWSLLDFAIPAKQQQFSLSWVDLLGGLLLLCDLDMGRCRVGLLIRRRFLLLCWVAKPRGSHLRGLRFEEEEESFQQDEA